MSWKVSQLELFYLSGLCGLKLKTKRPPELWPFLIIDSYKNLQSTCALRRQEELYVRLPLNRINEIFNVLKFGVYVARPVKLFSGIDCKPLF